MDYFLVFTKADYRRQELLHADLVTDYTLDIHTATTIIKNQVLYK